MWIQKVGGGGIAALEFAPDGRTLYTIDRGEWLTAWDTQTRTGKRLTTLGPGAYATSAFRWLPGERLAVAAGSSVRVWNVPANRADLSTELPYVATWLGCRITADGRLLAITRDRQRVATVDLSTGQAGASFAFPGPAPDPYQFDVSPDGRTCAFALPGQPVRVFEFDPGGGVLRNPVELAGTHHSFAVQYSPDGATLAVRVGAAGSAHRVQLWDFAAGHLYGEPVVCSMSTMQFAFNPVLPVFASCRSAAGGLTLWRRDTLEPLRTLDFDLGRRAQCVCFSPDGLTCVVGGSNKQFAVFDVDV